MVERYTNVSNSSYSRRVDVKWSTRPHSSGVCARRIDQLRTGATATLRHDVRAVTTSQADDGAWTSPSEEGLAGNRQSAVMLWKLRRACPWKERITERKKVQGGAHESSRRQLMASLACAKKGASQSRIIPTGIPVC